MTLRLGTRASALALAQSGLVADAVRRLTGLDVELVEIVTSGDRSKQPVSRLGAGLARLGRASEITEIIDPSMMLPAPAQGALAVECRGEDYDLLEVLAKLDHPETRAAVVAERALLATLEAGCSAPVAGLADVVPPGSVDAGKIHLRGSGYSPHARGALRLSRT